MPKLDKAQRREAKQAKQRNGMRVSGKNIALLMQAQEKRDKERLERRERERDTDK